MQVKRTTTISRRTLAFAAAGALGGVLYGLTWPNFEVWVFNAFFFIPLLLAVSRARHYKEVIVLSLSMGVVSCVIGFYWLSYLAQSFGGMPAWASPLVVFLYALVGQGQFLIFATALHSLRTKTKLGLNELPVLLPVAFYLVLEFFYPKIFCDTQGAMLHRWRNLIQICEITGVWGLTFLVFWFNAALARLIEGGLAHNRRLIRSAGLHLVVLVLVLAGCHYWGGRRIVALERELAHDSRRLFVKVIQANIGDADKLASEQGYSSALRQVMDTYSGMSRQAVKPNAAGVKPDLILWPETSYPLLYTHFMNPEANSRGEARDEWLMGLVEELGVPLYFGGYSSTGGKQDFNSAWLLTSRKEPAGLYQKHILLSFGETVPLGPLSPLVRALFPAVGNFGRGPGPANLAFRGLRLGPLICYETLDPLYTRRTAELGANLFVNLTNDSWFGPTSEPRSHLLLSLFRTIESRRPLLRATNTGISAYVDITGRIHNPTKLFEATIYEASIPVGKVRSTFFLRHGPWLILLCGTFCLGALAMIFLPVRRRARLRS